MNFPPPLPPISEIDEHKRKKASVRFWLSALCLLIGCNLGLILLRTTGIVRAFSIPTSAMSPTIMKGDCIIVEGFSDKFARPKRGDIVIFNTRDISDLGDQNYVKRLVGLPGDNLTIKGGKVWCNAQPLSLKNSNGDIEYTHLGIGRYLADEPDTVTVPPESYFVLGDNSSNSSDSRIWGFVPENSIIGRPFLRYWPIGRLGFIK